MKRLFLLFFLLIVKSGISQIVPDTIRVQWAGSGGSGISQLGDSPYGLTKPNDSTYTADTSLLLTILNAYNLFVSKEDTSNLKIITSNGLGTGVYTTWKPYKPVGLWLRDTTNTTNSNSPTLVFQSYWSGTGTKSFFRFYTDVIGSPVLRLQYSADTINWSTGFSFNRQGGFTSGSVTTTGDIIAGGLFSGNNLQLNNNLGAGVFGAHRKNNPNAILELVSPSSNPMGLIVPRMTTSVANIITGGVFRGTMLSGGTGYFDGGSGTRTITLNGGHGSGQSINVIISTGGVITSVSSIGASTGQNYRVGDTLTFTGFGGSGFQYRVDAITGDTSRTLIIADTSTNQVKVWNGEAYQTGQVYTTASALDLLRGQDIIFTGTAATYTLPNVDTTITGRQNRIIIMNIGSGSITVNSKTGTTIIPAGSTTPTGTITVSSGASTELFPTKNYYKVLYNQ